MAAPLASHMAVYLHIFSLAALRKCINQQVGIMMKLPKSNFQVRIRVRSLLGVFGCSCFYFIWYQQENYEIFPVSIALKYMNKISDSSIE
jgi:hypothetical protein